MTDISWLPNHAYSVGAVVTETTGLPLWRCTTAGTSAGAEPAWPTAAPWTVADGATLVWTLNTTFRESVRTGLTTTLENFRTANPTLVRKVWQVRPSSFTLGDLPCLAIGNLTENIVKQFSGQRHRDMGGITVEIIDRVPDNLEAALRADLLVDAILDYLYGEFHMSSPSSIVEPIGVTDGDTGAVTDGTNVFYFTNVLMFHAYIDEGRP